MDEAGSWHHVTNRAVARRTFFEGDADIRYFLACLARAVRRGEIEVHAFSILTTHFHLLVRSLKGDLAEAMQRVQRDYVRRFNRQRHRDGSLVRGRYWSRRIENYSYLAAVIRYIDANPVEANHASRGSDWRYGSARYFAGRGRAPRWLASGLIQRHVALSMGTDAYDPAHYDLVFLTRPGDAFIISRSRRATVGDVQIDDLVAFAPAPVIDWMRRKSTLADGTRPGMAVAPPTDVRATIDAHRKSIGGWVVVGSGHRHDGWSILEIALLRDLSGLTFRETAKVVALTERRARGAYERRRDLLVSDVVYAERAASAARAIAEPQMRGVPAGKMSEAYQVPYGRYWRVSSTELERRMTVAAL